MPAKHWIPAFAGMTNEALVRPSLMNAGPIAFALCVQMAILMCNLL